MATQPTRTDLVGRSRQAAVGAARSAASKKHEKGIARKAPAAALQARGAVPKKTGVARAQAGHSGHKVSVRAAVSPARNISAQAMKAAGSVARVVARTTSSVGSAALKTAQNYPVVSALLLVAAGLVVGAGATTSSASSASRDRRDVDDLCGGNSTNLDGLQSLYDGISAELVAANSTLYAQNFTSLKLTQAQRFDALRTMVRGLGNESSGNSSVVDLTADVNAFFDNISAEVNRSFAIITAKTGAAQGNISAIFPAIRAQVGGSTVYDGFANVAAFRSDLIAGKFDAEVAGNFTELAAELPAQQQAMLAAIEAQRASLLEVLSDGTFVNGTITDDFQTGDLDALLTAINQTEAVVAGHMDTAQAVVSDVAGRIASADTMLSQAIDLVSRESVERAEICSEFRATTVNLTLAETALGIAGAELDAARLANETCQAGLANVTVARDEALTRLAEVVAERDQCFSDKDALQTAFNLTADRLDSCSTNLTTFETRLNATQTELNRIEALGQATNESLVECEARFENATETISRLTGEKQELEEQIAVLSQNSTAREQDLQDQLTAKQAELAACSANFSSTLAELNQLRIDHSDLQAVLNTTRLDLAALQLQYNASLLDNALLQEALTDQARELLALASNNQTLTERVLNLTQTVAASEQDNAQLQAEIAANAQQLSECNQTVIELSANLTQALSELSSVGGERDAALANITGLTQQLVTVTQERDDLLSQVSAQVSQIAGLEATVRDLNATNIVYQSQVEVLQQLNATHTAALAQNAGTIANLTADLAACENITDTQSQLLTERSALITTLTGQVGNLTSERDSIRQQLNESQSEVAAKNAEFQALRAEQNVTEAELEQARTDLNASITLATALQTNLTLCESRLLNVTGQLAAAVENNLELNAEIATLNAQVGAQNATIASLTEQLDLALSSCENSTAALLAQLADSQARVAALEAQNTILQQLNATHTAALAQNAGTIANLTADLAACENITNAQSELLTERSDLITTLTGQVGNLTSERDSIRQQLNESQSEVAAKNAELQALRAEQNVTEADLEQARADLNASITLATALQTNLTLCESRLQTVTSELAAAVASNLELNAEIATLNAQVGAQNATITDLTEQLGLALSSCGNSTAALLELLAETQSQVTVNRDGWAAANATITTLEEAVTQCELERTELRANLTQSEAERAFLQGFLDQANEIIAQIQALNITGNGTVVDEGNLVETIEGLLSQIDSFEQREAEQNELVTQLRANFTEVSALLESCSSNHSLALATIQGLQAQVASLQGNVTLLAEIIATQDARISEYETELESIDFALAINGSAANRTQAIVALNMRIFQLETALNASTEVNVNLTTLIAECVQERDSLRADVSSLEAANAVLQNTTIALQELTAEQAVQIQTANATISVYQTTVLSLEELIQAYQSLETSVLAQLTQTQADVAMCEQTLGACQGRVGLADESGSGDDGSGSGDFGSSLGTLSIAELGQRLSGTAAAFAQCNAQLQACHTSEVAEKDARIAELTQQRDLLSQRDQENQAFLSTLPAVVALMNEDSAKLTCLATRLNVSLTQELTHLQQAARVGVAADGTCIDPTAANPTSTAALQASMARLQALNESIAVCNMRSARVEKELQVCQSLIAASQVVPGVPCPEAVNAKAGFGENTGYTFTGVLLILAALGGGGYVAAHKVKLDAEDRDWWASMKHYIGCCCKSSSRSRVAPQNDFPMQQLNRHGDAAAAGELSEVITVAPANGQLRVGRRDGVVPGRNLPPLMERGATTAAAAAAATLPTAGDSKPQPPKPRALPPMNAGLSAKPAAAVQRAQPETLGGGNTRRSSAWGTAATAAAATLPTAGNSKPQPPAPGTKMKFNPGFRRSSALGTAAPAAASVVSEGEERAVRPQAETLGGNTPAGSPDRRAVTFATTPLPGAVTYGETPTEEYDGGGVALDMITPTRTASNTAQSRERLARSFRTATVTANRMKDVEAINKLLKHANDPAHLEKSAITLIRYLHEKRVPAEKVDEVNAVIRAQTSKISSVYLDAGNSESLETRLHASGGSMKIFIARVRALKAALEEAGCPLNEETVRPSLASSDIGAKRQACLTPVQIRELPDEQDQNVLRAYFISLPQKDAVGRTSEA